MRLDKETVCELAGWAGMMLVQTATLPPIIGVLLGTNSRLPPMSMVLLVWAGLALYFVRAVAQNDKLYMFSNGLGFALNSVLLSFIVFG